MSEVELHGDENKSKNETDEKIFFSSERDKRDNFTEIQETIEFWEITVSKPKKHKLKNKNN